MVAVVGASSDRKKFGNKALRAFTAEGHTVIPINPNETEVERYPEAFYLPMSQFDPAAIPDPQGRRVVFACRSGNRSVTASLMAQAAGLPYDAHLAGGIKAWKELGLPTES